MESVSAYGAQAADVEMEPINIDRRAVQPGDVKIEIEYCGVCHSDIHQVRNDWHNSIYPVVPGHEIIGRVKEVGSEVSKFSEGDLVGVGVLVDSCRHCDHCKNDMEQYCENGNTLTYNGHDKYLDQQTFGGYSEMVVVDQEFVLNIPESIDPKGTAPLLCAGITTWSPLSHWKVGEGDKVGVIGLGGLGHMGVKFASALGAEVVMITRSPEKSEDARALGADDVLISTDPEQMEAHKGSFDFLLNTIPVGHDLDPYIKLLAIDATMVLVGALEPLGKMHGGGLIGGRKRVAGSSIGGIKETQEMLDFCGEHHITSDVEMIDMQHINEAFERVVNSDVKYRFVIDMQSLKK